MAGGIGRRHPDRPRPAGHRADPPAPSVHGDLGSRDHLGSSPYSAGCGPRCRAHRRPSGRCPRPDPRRPANLGHRPLQPPLRLLHARGGNDLSPPLGNSHLRRDRPGGTGGVHPRGHLDPAHRGRTAGPEGPPGPRGPPGSARIRRPGHDDERGAAGRQRRTVGGLGTSAGERQLRLVAGRPVRTDPSAGPPRRRPPGHGRGRGRRARRR